MKMDMIDPENPTAKESVIEQMHGCFFKLLITVCGSAFTGCLAWLAWTYWGLGAHLWPELPERLARPSFLDVWGLNICVRAMVGHGYIGTQIRYRKEAERDCETEDGEA